MARKLKYKYYVSYAHGENALGYGWAEILRQDKIKTGKDVQDVLDLIVKSSKTEIKNVTILYWRRFD